MTKSVTALTVPMPISGSVPLKSFACMRNLLTIRTAWSPLHGSVALIVRMPLSGNVRLMLFLHCVPTVHKQNGNDMFLDFPRDAPKTTPLDGIYVLLMSSQCHMLLLMLLLFVTLVVTFVVGWGFRDVLDTWED
eukprot:6472727-Amphidinium_carterae.1